MTLMKLKIYSFTDNQNCDSDSVQWLPMTNLNPRHVECICVNIFLVILSCTSETQMHVFMRQLTLTISKAQFNSTVGEEAKWLSTRWVFSTVGREKRSSTSTKIDVSESCLKLSLKVRVVLAPVRRWPHYAGAKPSRAHERDVHVVPVSRAQACLSCCSLGICSASVVG